MKIRYLQATHDTEAGEIREMEDEYANVLILLGYAEVYEEASSDDDSQADGNDDAQNSDVAEATSFDGADTQGDDAQAQADTQQAGESEQAQASRHYEKMKVAELKAELEKYGVTPPPNATKADLIDLLKQFDVMAD